MADDASFVCFRAGRCDLDQAVEALRAIQLKVARRGKELRVHYPDGPMLRVAYVEDDYVAEEASEFAETNPEIAKCLPCEVRFEILIDDLEAVLEDYNTLFAVQEALFEITGGFVFNTWNGEFPWP